MHDVFAYVQQIAVNNDDNNSTSNASLVWDLAELFTKPVHWRNSFLSLRFVDKQFSEWFLIRKKKYVGNWSNGCYIT